MSWRETPRERLLSYRSIFEWRDKENAPPYVTDEMSATDRDLYLRQYNELYTKLWNEHYEALPSEVKQLFETKTHPRFHYSMEYLLPGHEGDVKPFLLQLKGHLESLGFRGKFKVTDSPFSDLRLGVLLDPAPSREQLYGLPQFFAGFEVLYYQTECKQLFAHVDD